MKEGGGAVGEKTYYWYAGTNNGNAVTADNFTDVASRIPESEVPETGSVTANGQYIYFVMPETKHLESLTDGNGSAVEFTCTDVMGYRIYKTNDKINGSINYSVAQTVYYWYVGTTQPTAVNEPSNWNCTTQDAGFSVTVNLTSGNTWFAYPSDWNYSAVDSSGDEFSFNAWVQDAIKYSIDGYILLRMSLGADERVTITFSK